MQFAAALSRRERTDEAVEQVAASIRRQISGAVDLVIVFFTAQHRANAPLISAGLRSVLSPKGLIGCSCEGVIGEDSEVEREPGISVLAARLGAATATPFLIGAYELAYLLERDGDRDQCRALELTSAEPGATQAYLLLGDPFTTPIVEFIELLAALEPDVPTFGGMASSGRVPGGNALLMNDRILTDGVVGLRFSGPIRIDTVVSQGCRPVGEPMLVTRAEDNIIQTLGGRPALEKTKEIVNGLEPEDQQLVANGLYLGIVINEYTSDFERGDFLVRNVLGYDPETGALAIGDNVRAGQTVQFHVRDAQTATDDLRLLMAKACEDAEAPAGGLLFSCNGRGIEMFEVPNHDVRNVLDHVPETPIAGFFAAGEIGPIGGKSFLHGQTASIVLFRSDLT